MVSFIWYELHCLQDRNSFLLKLSYTHTFHFQIYNYKSSFYICMQSFIGHKSLYLYILVIPMHGNGLYSHARMKRIKAIHCRPSQQRSEQRKPEYSSTKKY